ncbi:hypothetical protein E1A38_20925 [Salmonella enterica subsp. enterica serovar Kisangani]|nr:hypothetical protein [Salmonella enterica subsp. enterica serovar Kisangani]
MKTSKMRTVGIVLAGMMSVSSSVLAETQGTQSFTANIPTNTCVLNNIDNVFSFTLNGSTNPGKYNVWALGTGEIKVTGCDPSLTELKVTATYTPYYSAIANKGSLGNDVYSQLTSSVDGPAPVLGGRVAQTWASGSERKVNITNGEATMEYYVPVMASVDSRNLRGTVKSTVSFLVDMQ